jgi:hypothetical protein
MPKGPKGKGPPLTYKQYKELGYSQLHSELKQMLAQAERMRCGLMRLSVLTCFLHSRPCTI